MKTVILTITFITLIIVGCYAQDTPNNGLMKLQLKGNVKSVRETSFQALEKFGKIQKGQKSRAEYYYEPFTTFNETGDIAEKTNFNIDGSPLCKHVYKYNDKKNAIEIIVYTPDGLVTTKHVYKYNDKGQQIEWNCYNSKGSLTYKQIDKYDEKGNIIEDISSDSTGKNLSRTTYKYDINGNQIEQDSYAADGRLYIIFTRNYNKQGQVIETNSVNKFSKSVTKRSLLYNDKGDLTEERYYDSKDNLYEKYIYDYSYDNNGNWLIQTKAKYNYPANIFDNTESYIIEREIIYY